MKSAKEALDTAGGGGGGGAPGREGESVSIYCLQEEVPRV
jgi:hypothetical protein